MRRLTLAAVLLSLAAGPALAADPVRTGSAEGVWLVQDKDARVRVAPCQEGADRLCGEIVWLKAPLEDDGSGQPRRDKRNPDPALRRRPILGLTIIRDFRPAGPGRWEGGKIYDPKSGKTYTSKMRLAPDGALRVDGCVLVFCQSQTWTRAS
ncbi:DUF2147 domain-containing protein [Phenylobacterium sp. LjRoot225]|uniref:DUF2147 domain-containing protein n=1 Tax=Phenylobacterium sp. LjRoot225 TaxID=3342285 RepID=UPI003ECE08B6